VHVKGNLPSPLVENSGTGMDSLNTFNVSTAAAIVASACGVTMARHGARALTSFCGTVDILESLGIDVECDGATVEHSIKSVGIGLFNGMSQKVHPTALGRILSQIRFGSTLNIAASLANPARPTHAVRGVYAEGLVSLVSEVMKAIGFQRGLIVYGKDDYSEKGMDELSIAGETVAMEFCPNQAQTSYTLRPEDVGLKTARFSEIAATGTIETERVRFLQVLAGKGCEACVDFTCYNAGAILYVAGITETLEHGVRRSKETIEAGSAIQKLRNWVCAQNREPDRGLQCFEQVLRQAGVEQIN